MLLSFLSIPVSAVLVAQAAAADVVERLRVGLQGLGVGGGPPGVLEILFAAILSFGLCCLVSKLYQATYRGRECPQAFIHAMLILGVVVCVFVMVIQSGDSDYALATGFGMFAAFSMIRFRTAVSEPRDIGFIFFAMTAGLAVGARQYLLATAGTAFVSGIIWIFSRGDWFAGPRFTHTVWISVPAGLAYEQPLAEVLGRHAVRHSVISVDTGKKGTHTEVCYAVALASPERLGDFLRDVQQASGGGRVVVKQAGTTRSRRTG